MVTVRSTVRASKRRSTVRTWIGEAEAVVSAPLKLLSPEGRRGCAEFAVTFQGYFVGIAWLVFLIDHFSELILDGAFNFLSLIFAAAFITYWGPTLMLGIQKGQKKLDAKMHSRQEGMSRKRELMINNNNSSRNNSNNSNSAMSRSDGGKKWDNYCRNDGNNSGKFGELGNNSGKSTMCASADSSSGACTAAEGMTQSLQQDTNNNYNYRNNNTNTNTNGYSTENVFAGGDFGAPSAGLEINETKDSDASMCAVVGSFIYGVVLRVVLKCEEILYFLQRVRFRAKAITLLALRLVVGWSWEVVVEYIIDLISERSPTDGMAVVVTWCATILMIVFAVVLHLTLAPMLKKSQEKGAADDAREELRMQKRVERQEREERKERKERECGGVKREEKDIERDIERGAERDAERGDLCEGVVKKREEEEEEEEDVKDEDDDEEDDGACCACFRDWAGGGLACLGLCIFVSL